MTSNPSVLIVGGGFAGVGCAKELARHDVDVTLFQPQVHYNVGGGVDGDGQGHPRR